VTDSKPLDYRVVSGNPTPAELGAVAAVLARALEELAADDARRDLPAPSAWERGKRAIREPVHPSPGSWRGFSG
jgi:uncharacterized protein (DUF1800 family)